MSTTGTNDSTFSRLSVQRSSPSAKTHKASAHVAAGDFSKPRIHPRSRRDTQSSARSEGGSSSSSAAKRGAEFQYYGRHGNQWLFNDFSVTDAVAKGFRRVFGKEGEKGDWYEDRER